MITMKWRAVTVSFEGARAAELRGSLRILGITEAFTEIPATPGGHPPLRLVWSLPASVVDDIERRANGDAAEADELARQAVTDAIWNDASRVRAQAR